MKPGDRVYVTDPGLAQLRAVMASYGEPARPNHHGTVERIEGDTVYIAFDSEDGEGQGQLAPYPARQVCALGEKP